MDFRLGRPFPAPLTPEVKGDAKQAPQCEEAHVQHNGREIAILLYPRRDELAKSVAPDVLVDGDGDKERAGYGLVAVDSVGTGNGGERRDLNPGSSVAYYDDCLSFFLILSDQIREKNSS